VIAFSVRVLNLKTADSLYYSGERNPRPESGREDGTERAFIFKVVQDKENM
jgi:hypothetical protein